MGPMRLLCCFLALAVVAGVVQGERWCTFSFHDDYVDCSYINTTAVFTTDRGSRYNNVAWSFRGNNLRSLSANVWCVNKLDLSNTGLVREQFLKISSNYDCAVSYLDVSFNYLKSLQLGPTCYLKTLNMSNNVFTDLQTYDCQNLETLRFANNKITQLTGDMFSFLPRLKYLDLSGNPIASASRDTFQPLQELDTLRLDNTYTLEYLPSGTLHSLSSLRYLYLAGNKFTNLFEDFFGNMSKLEILELQRNRLDYVSDYVFQYMPALRILFLDDNALQYLSPAVFARLHSLETFSVRGNRLTALPSFHECSGPLKIAMFTDNQIGEVNEVAVRSLLRHGFRLGDLRGNPVSSEVLQWMQNVSDMSVSEQYVAGVACSAIRLSAKDHGMIAFDN